ncbi:MAG: GNAT family N-acetyltransferase [Pseudomonadota bacterium]
MSDYEVRVMTAAEREQAVNMAAAEGWNPGHQDGPCFAAVDPEGFWGGFLDDQMIASISVVNYDEAFAFLGFYIVAPEFRGKGYGFQLWQSAIAHAGSRVIGLDGVVDQQENYRTSGFELAYRNIRYGGVPGVAPAASPAFRYVVTRAPSKELEDLDTGVFPASRTAFWDHWLTADGHITVEARSGNQLAAFGTLRPCRTGFKIGPLVASSPSAARGVLSHLLQRVPQGDSVFLDVPEPNPDARKLAENLGLSAVFETARMYRGSAPQLNTDHVFGVTTFELG